MSTIGDPPVSTTAPGVQPTSSIEQPSTRPPSVHSFGTDSTAIENPQAGDSSREGSIQTGTGTMPAAPSAATEDPPPADVIPLSDQEFQTFYSDTFSRDVGKYAVSELDSFFKNIVKMMAMTDVGEATKFQIFTCLALCNWLITVRHETDGAIRSTQAVLAAGNVRWPTNKGGEDYQALSTFSRGRLRAQGEVYKHEFKETVPWWKTSKISGEETRGTIIENWKKVRKLLVPFAP